MSHCRRRRSSCLISARTRAALKAAKARGVVLGNPQQAARNRELALTEAENLRPVLTELKHLSSRQIAAELSHRRGRVRGR